MDALVTSLQEQAGWSWRGHGMEKTGRGRSFGSPATLFASLGIPVILPWSILEQLPDSRT